MKLTKLFARKQWRNRIVAIVTCLCVMPLYVHASSSLVIWAKDGSKFVYDLTRRPKILFTDTDLLLLHEGGSVAYPLGSLLRTTFEVEETNGIIDAETSQGYSFRDNTLIFHAPQSTTVTVYSIDGRELLRRNFKEGQYALTLSTLFSGHCIVKINNHTFKVYIR